MTDSERTRAYRLKDPEKTRRQRREYAKRRKHVIVAYRKKYYAENKSKILEKVSQWAKENPKKLRNRRAKYKPRRNELDRVRRATDLNYRIGMVLRCRFHGLLRGHKGKKSASFAARLGCSVADFRIYIESLFKDGMNWENYGEWELDHVIPCALFDLTNKDHHRRCFHFSNYQPLWRLDNQRKHTKVLDAQFRLL